MAVSPGLALKDIPQETNSKDNGLKGCFQQPHSRAQESNTDEADHGETLIDKENQEIKIHLMAARTFRDDSNYN
jgi:hypothetical protein